MMKRLTQEEAEWHRHLLMSTMDFAAAKRAMSVDPPTLSLPQGMAEFTGWGPVNGFGYSTVALTSTSPGTRARLSAPPDAGRISSASRPGRPPSAARPASARARLQRGGASAAAPVLTARPRLVGRSALEYEWLEHEHRPKPVPTAFQDLEETLAQSSKRIGAAAAAHGGQRALTEWLSDEGNWKVQTSKARARRWAKPAASEQLMLTDASGSTSCTPRADTNVLEEAELTPEAAVRVEAMMLVSTTRSQQAMRQAAAARVQAMARGKTARGEYAAALQEQAMQQAAAVRVQAIARGKITRGYFEMTRREEQTAQQAAAVKVQAMAGGKTAREHRAASRQEQAMQQQQAAAVRVQSMARRKTARGHYAAKLQEEQALIRVAALEANQHDVAVSEANQHHVVAQQAAAVKVQSMARGKTAREQRSGLRQQQHLQAVQQQQQAAVRVQSMARGKTARGQRATSQAAAVRVQAMARGKTARGDSAKLRHRRLVEEKAAVIQSAVSKALGLAESDSAESDGGE